MFFQDLLIVLTEEEMVDEEKVEAKVMKEENNRKRDSIQLKTHDFIFSFN